MEENQPIIWEQGTKVQFFGKWLMEVRQDVVTGYWYLRYATYDYTIFELSKNIKTDFKERTSLDFDAIAQSFDGITKGELLPEFATIESLRLFVLRINELYDNAKEKKKCGEPKEYRLAPIPDVWKPTPTVGNYKSMECDFSSLYSVIPAGKLGITYRGDSKSQNSLWWYLDILRERKKQQEKTNDSTITTTKKTKNYETELQDKGPSLSRGDLSEGHQLRSRKNKARIVCGHLGDKTKDC